MDSRDTPDFDAELAELIAQDQELAAVKAETVASLREMADQLEGNGIPTSRKKRDRLVLDQINAIARFNSVARRAELAATEALDAEEKWRAHPETADFGVEHAFVLYYLLEPPDDEFDGDFVVSVGACTLNPGDDDERMKFVLLGVDGSQGTRLTNIVLTEEEAQQLAQYLQAAAAEVECYNAFNAPTEEEKREAMDELMRQVVELERERLDSERQEELGEQRP
ncbi:hypothetical protein A5753_21345 [Mycobacterium sp. 852002-51971_SCH5477799-a]|uniref:hypothetical protein n=1 Tax=Mycobacterium sp. 852002-51971_SCH5477799-a TaxID=1834106 RepID=UPI0007FFA6C7|nr:hypothetical protein [Mycobacterium sp. 852002-51971_SCH5477799-a]OBF69610.1 hypothetical protein A5753_21345 [Mycobacterium sp. 852002-51971_SCH5477799-a]